MSPVLLLHGALGSSTQLETLKNALEASEYVVHSLNFSGHSGKPFGSQFGIEAFADDIISYLNKHQLKKVDIFGYSMGGYVALWLAYSQPDYVGRIITLGTKFDWSPEAASKEVKKVDPDKILKKIPAFARILQHRHAPNDWKTLLHSTAEMMTRLGNKPLITDTVLQKIENDVLILLGDLDDMADMMFSKKVAQALPKGRFASLEKTPHPIERVDVKFLQRLLMEKFK